MIRNVEGKNLMEKRKKKRKNKSKIYLAYLIGIALIVGSMVKSYCENKEFSKFYNDMPKGYAGFGQVINTSLTEEELNKSLDDLFKDKKILRYRAIPMHQKGQVAIECVAKEDDGSEILREVITMITKENQTDESQNDTKSKIK